jgi:signal transduction histidine kinase
MNTVAPPELNANDRLRSLATFWPIALAGLCSAAALVVFALTPARANGVLAAGATLLFSLTILYTFAQQRGKRDLMAAANWIGGPALGLIAAFAAQEFLVVGVLCLVTGIAYAVSSSSRRMMFWGLIGSMITLVAMLALSELHRIGVLTSEEFSPGVKTMVIWVGALGIGLDMMQRFWRFHQRIDNAIGRMQSANETLRQAQTKLENDLAERKALQFELAKTAATHERNRVARELHDSVSQALFGVVLGSRAALENLRAKPDSAEEALRYATQLADNALSEMRSLIYTLRPETLANEGLLAVLKRHIEALTLRKNIPIRFETALTEPDTTLDVKETLFRIATEALHNALNHSGASAISIALDATAAHIVLTVQDNGIGFDPNTRSADHFGLRTMRERAVECGGTLAIQTSPGEGVTITARLPLRTATSASA